MTASDELIMMALAVCSCSLVSDFLLRFCSQRRLSGCHGFSISRPIVLDCAMHAASKVSADAVDLATN